MENQGVAPEIPGTERVGSMDGIGLQVLTFARKETRPAAHPSAFLPEPIRGPVRYGERAEQRNGQIRLR